VINGRSDSLKRDFGKENPGQKGPAAGAVAAPLAQRTATVPIAANETNVDY